ncbi:MAG TPA: nitroreductase/quinone reductase family protein [Ornithinibacter sp.]|nr:nitroreductase/quinone reductase family protein [Ornithinibacter sp.]
MTSTPSAPVERAIPPALLTRVGNPVLTWLLSGRRRATKVGQDLVLLHVTGRRTGRVYSTPVAYHRRPDGRLLVLTSSGWRVNLRGGPTPVELTLFGRRVAASALLEEDPSVVAGVYEGLIDQIGLAAAGRRLGIRIGVDRAPTHEELRDAAEREHLSVVLLDVDAEAV